MIKYLLLFSFFCVTIFLLGCNSNIDFKETQQFSKNIAESKLNKVFIAEYDILEIKKYDLKIQFPIEQLWSEHLLFLVLDSNGRTSYRIDSTKSDIVFKLNPNSVIKESEFLKKWIIWDNDSSSFASIKKAIALLPKKLEVPDTLFFTISFLDTPYDFKNNLRRVASFSAVRKNKL